MPVSIFKASLGELLYHWSDKMSPITCWRFCRCFNQCKLQPSFDVYASILRALNFIKECGILAILEGFLLLCEKWGNPCWLWNVKNILENGDKNTNYVFMLDGSGFWSIPYFRWSIKFPLFFGGYHKVVRFYSLQKLLQELKWKIKLIWK